MHTHILLLGLWMCCRPYLNLRGLSPFKRCSGEETLSIRGSSWASHLRDVKNTIMYDENQYIAGWAVWTESNSPRPMETAVDATATRKGEMGDVRFKR